MIVKSAVHDSFSSTVLRICFLKFFENRRVCQYSLGEGTTSSLFPILFAVRKALVTKCFLLFFRFVHHETTAVKVFPHFRLCATEIQWSLVNTPNTPTNAGLRIVFVVSRIKLLRNCSSWRWIETPWNPFDATGLIQGETWTVCMHINHIYVYPCTQIIKSFQCYYIAVLYHNGLLNIPKGRWPIIRPISLALLTWRNQDFLSFI